MPACHRGKPVVDHMFMMRSESLLLDKQIEIRQGLVMKGEHCSQPRSLDYESTCPWKEIACTQ